MGSSVFQSFMLFIFFLSLGACQSEKSVSQPVEEDTRVLVRQAFDSVDFMKITVQFNSKKAAGIKKMIDVETDPSKKMQLTLNYAQELLKAGQIGEALKIFNAVTSLIVQNNIPLSRESKRNLYSMVGIGYMRMGETDNCVQNHNHQSCFLPIREAGIHQLTAGSQNAIRTYETALQEFPDDLETKYLLNIAYMTLGLFPDRVPHQYRLDPSWFQSGISMKPFREIAGDLHVNRKGHAGGVILDDFTNDGWLDIVATSWDPSEELVFYVNNGNGSFSDMTEAYGLKGHVGILNLNHSDFNNDGWLDIYLMRGAWLGTEGNIPNTLLMNTGNGSFQDVTIKYGLTHFAPTQTSAWADFNLDGWIDLVVANESEPGHPNGIDLYINESGRFFTNQASSWGLEMNQFFKGCSAFDANNDGYPDIYFSCLAGDNLLAINQGKSGKNGFVWAGPEIGIQHPEKSFPCWTFDYNNDGHEDIFISGYSNEDNPATYWMQSKMGNPAKEFLPKLYRNNGGLSFDEVGFDSGLNEVAFTMGCNFGDINTDGFLDFCLSTGNPHYQSIVPNKMYLNMAGQRFEDVSFSGGFANIQKGHGVSFGDLDHDGDEDIYIVMGGAFDGDYYYNTLFENPNQDQNNWVILKLTGLTANKAAIGARVTLLLEEKGQERKICRTVTSGASFGANSFALEIGLGKAEKIKTIQVRWPCRDCPDQIYSGLEINKAYELTEGNDHPSPMEYIAVPFSVSAGQHIH